MFATFIFPKCSVDVPSDISTLYDFNVDLGRENNMFNMLGGNVANFGSLGYFSGHDARYI